MDPSPKKSAGFTVIELMMVVSIISFLTILALPGVSSARNKSIAMKCVSNQRAIWNAVHRYEFETYTTLFTIRNNGVAIRDSLVAANLIKRADSFECPASQVTDRDDILLIYNGVDFDNTRCSIQPLKHQLR